MWGHLHPGTKPLKRKWSWIGRPWSRWLPMKRRDMCRQPMASAVTASTPLQVMKYPEILQGLLMRSASIHRPSTGPDAMQHIEILCLVTWDLMASDLTTDWSQSPKVNSSQMLWRYNWRVFFLSKKITDVLYAYFGPVPAPKRGKRDLDELPGSIWQHGSGVDAKNQNPQVLREWDQLVVQAKGATRQDQGGTGWRWIWCCDAVRLWDSTV